MNKYLSIPYLDLFSSSPSSFSKSSSFTIASYRGQSEFFDDFDLVILVNVP